MLLPTGVLSINTLRTNATANRCLVHKYSEDQSKCDFNWTSRDVVSGLMSNAISPFTPIIGMDVVKDRNLPWMRPSLFVPLATVLHLYQHRKRYLSVTRNDLILFNALGYRGSLAAGPNRQLVIDALTAAAGLSELSMSGTDEQQAAGRGACSSDLVPSPFPSGQTALTGQAAARGTQPSSSTNTKAHFNVVGPAATTGASSSLP
jgi:hypothetical protein